MIRIGHGFDIHRTVTNRTLTLGGCKVPSNFGLQGHSDADVLLHAIIDALLGALALGDIGQWFPDTDSQFKDAESTRLLKTVLNHEIFSRWQLVNLDATILAEKPKLAPVIPTIRSSLKDLLNMPVDGISIKAKTMEGLGEIGEGRAIAVHVVILLTDQVE